MCSLLFIGGFADGAASAAVAEGIAEQGNCGKSVFIENDSFERELELIIKN